MRKQSRLGRGLDALLEPRRHDAMDPSSPVADSSAAEMPVDALQPGSCQPRRRRSEESLTELAASIREQGILQPLIVRPVAATGSGRPGHEIVAGERRWRAAKIAGLATVPVVVRELDDKSALAVALIENLQREDLNPIDQAHSLWRLADEFGLTHEQVAQAVGRSRASVSNLLRLLDLHDDVKELLVSGTIDMGHARALLSLEATDQLKMARKAAKGMSVRQVEQAVREQQSASVPAADRQAEPDLQTRWLQRQLAEAVGQRISLRPGASGEYTLRVGFRDLLELHDALNRIRRLIDSVRDTAGPRVRDSTK